MTTYPAKVVRAFELDGTPIETTVPMQRLKKTTPVLLCDDAKVDPFYLQMIKAGTMILVMIEDVASPAQAIVPNDKLVPAKDVP